MTIQARSFEELEQKMPGALLELKERWSSPHEPVDEIDLGDWENFLSDLRDSYHSSTTEADSLYITKTYVTKTENFSFSISGSSYLKDQGICDQELDEYICVTDLRAAQTAELEKQRKNTAEWLTVFSNGTFSPEYIAKALCDVPIPKELK